MERKQNISLEELRKLRFITTPGGRDGVTTPDGSLDYSIHGQNYLREEKPEGRSEGQSMYDTSHDDLPIGY